MSLTIMVLSVMRSSALVFAGLSLTTTAIDETFVNARWTIDLDEMDDDTSYFVSGVVKYDGQPLCDDGMNDAAATALCKHFMLGNYGEWEGIDVGTSDFGADNMSCPDDAKGLGDCTYDTDFEDCFAFEGVRIKCSSFTLQKPPEIDEVYEHNLPKFYGIVAFNFYPVCDDFIDENAANALCRTMGLGTHGEFWKEQEVGVDEFSMDNLSCPPGAESIRECDFLHQAGEDCSSGEGVALYCHDGFRLYGDGWTNQGFVLYKGKAVCEVGDMTPLAADLLCQNMGKGTTGVWETRNIVQTSYWQDRGFGADNPSCQRGETDLSQCDWHETEDLPCASDRALHLTCSFDGWTMEPARDEIEHGEDRKHSGFVYYNGEPLCDDFMSNREADMLCYTMYYGDYQDITLGSFRSDPDFRGVWETRDVQTDNFGADNLWCPASSPIQSIRDCEWTTDEDCTAGEGVWLNCHTGWLLERSVWGGDEDKVAGFLVYDRQAVCANEGFNQAAADAVCKTWYGPHVSARFEQKVKSSTVIFSDSPSVTLECPANARTVADCTRGETVSCDMTEAVYLECF